MSRGSRDQVQHSVGRQQLELRHGHEHAAVDRSPARRHHHPRRSSALAVVLLTLSGLLVGTIAAPAAQAYPGPVSARTSNVVTADALPTVQINGVVWSQAIAGGLVFAGGQFTNARPAGAPAGSQTTARSNILAYNLSTGVLASNITTSTNGAVYAVAASPDGTKIYIGGNFTQVNGVTKNRIAAINASDGKLITSFTASAGSQVRAIVATNDRVYFGGQFTSANGTGRNRVAAVQASNGALTSWNPNADYTVRALVMSPDGTRVIVGGAFQNIGGAANYGLAAVSATSGASQSFPVNQIVRNAGPNSAILGLTTDGTNIYGNGYTYGSGGNFEGTFSATPGGTLNWVEDCHGDTYANYSNGPVVYTVSHAHYCANMGGYGQSEPSPWVVNMRHALAFTKNATGTANPDPHGYPDWSGRSTPSLINWFPDMTSGSYTGQGQAAWSITGSGDYIVLGGEFPTVNGTGQQGLVRFKTGTSANGPRVTGAKFMPTLNSFSAGTMHVGFQTNWDRDDTALTYRVVRDSSVTIYTGTVNSTFWNRPFINITDTVAAGSHRYRIYVTDPAGNQVAGDTATGTVSGSGAAPSNYANTVASQGAGIYWRLGEASGATALDWAGASPGVAGSGVTRGVAGAIVGDSNTAATFNGTSSAHFAGQTAASSPAVFSASIWFKASSTSRGKLVGYGDQQTSNSAVYDRHIYMDNNGRLNFGVAPRARITITSPSSYRDNQWHQAIATLSSNGMRLYVDGAQVASRSDVVSAEDVWGFWRVGGDTLSSSWANAPSSAYFNGSLDEFSVYPTALSAAQVAAQWNASGRGNAAALLAAPDDALARAAAPAAGDEPVQAPEVAPAVENAAPTVAFTSSASDLVASLDASTSADADGSIASYAWDFGDSSTGSGAKAAHTYATPGTYDVTLTVTDNNGATGTVSTPVTVTAPAAAVTAAPIATDSFDRTVKNGWGSADPGGTWTLDGKAAQFGVANKAASVQTAAGSAAGAYLKSVSAADLVATVDISVDQVSVDGVSESVAVRRVGTSDYRAGARITPAGVEVTLAKVVNGVETQLVTQQVPGLTYQSGDTLRLALQATGTGPTALAAKVWKVGADEPTGWQATTTDSEASLQAAGAVGLQSAASGAAGGLTVTSSFDNLVVRAATP